MMTYAARVEQAIDYLVMWLRVRAPKDTWNLANNAIRKVWNPVRLSFEVVIGGEIAPYAIFTNEPWTADRWNGARNPNEGWIQNAIEESKPVLKEVLSGKITKQDYLQLMTESKAILKSLADQRIGGAR